MKPAAVVEFGTSFGISTLYVRAPGSGHENVTFPVEDGMEISCRT